MPSKDERPAGGQSNLAAPAPESDADAKDAQRDALWRLRWRESTEYQGIASLRSRALMTGVSLAALVLTLWYATPLRYDLGIDSAFSAVIGLYIGLFALMIPLYPAALRVRNARRAFDDRMTLGLVSDLQEEERALAQSEDGKTDLASLWAITQKRIDLYHSIATTQAQNSFRVGQMAAVAGFGSIIALGALAAFTKSGTGAIAASVIGVAGAAMSGYIGATFMRAQAEASAQLRAFFLQPVEFSRMLGVERLLDDLTDSDRAAAVMHIITSMMPLTENRGAGRP